MMPRVRSRAVKRPSSPRSNAAVLTASPSLVLVTTHDVPIEITSVLEEYSNGSTFKVKFKAPGIIIESEARGASYFSTILAPAMLFKGTDDFEPRQAKIDVCGSDGKLYEGRLMACDFHYNLAAIEIEYGGSPLKPATLRSLNDVTSIDIDAYVDPLSRGETRFQLRGHSNVFQVQTGTKIMIVNCSFYSPISVEAACGVFRAYHHFHYDCKELYWVKCVGIDVNKLFTMLSKEKLNSIWVIEVSKKLVGGGICVSEEGFIITTVAFHDEKRKKIRGRSHEGVWYKLKVARDMGKVFILKVVDGEKNFSYFNLDGRVEISRGASLYGVVHRGSPFTFYFGNSCQSYTIEEETEELRWSSVEIEFFGLDTGVGLEGCPLFDTNNEFIGIYSSYYREYGLAICKTNLRTLFRDFMTSFDVGKGKKRRRGKGGNRDRRAPKRQKSAGENTGEQAVVLKELLSTFGDLSTVELNDSGPVDCSNDPGGCKEET